MVPRNSSCLTLLGLSRLSHKPTTRIATTCYIGLTVTGRPLVFLVSYSTTADIFLCRYSLVSFAFSFSSTNAAPTRGVLASFTRCGLVYGLMGLSFVLNSSIFDPLFRFLTSK